MSHSVLRGPGCVATLIVLCASVLSAAAQETAGPASETATPGAFQGRPLYEIGIGDKLDVFVVEDGVHTECVVRPDGRITLPLVGDLQAEGVTPPDLALRIKEGLTPYQKDPTVTVAVLEINSYRVYVLGAVNNQMMIQSTTPLRLLQALAMAGGLNEFAKKSIVVLRERRGAPPLRLLVNYGRIVDGDQPETNIRLEAGDTLVAE